MASLSESENVQLVVNAHDGVLACIIYLDFAGLCYPIRTYFSQDIPRSKEPNEPLPMRA